MSKQVKILFFMEDLCYGGTQKQTLELACRLDRNKFIPVFLTLTGRTDLDGIAEKAGIKVINMGKTRKATPLFFAKLYNVLKGIAADILVPCTALPNIWGRIWGKILKIPVIVGTCRGGGAPMRQHEWLLHRACTHIICNSQASIAAMTRLGVKQQKLSYIPNGVDTNIFAPSNKSSQRLVLCVARLCKDKDHLTLLKAFDLVAGKIPDARLRLVGSGPEEETLRAFIKERLHKATAQRVEFAGDSENPAKHYSEAEVFALTSIREGQPNVILEAMSCGLPVCATNVGGIPGLIKNGTTGWLNEPGNVESIAENLCFCLLHPDKSRQLGQNGRDFVQNNFSYSKMVASHEQLFLELWAKYGSNSYVADN